MRTTLNIDQDIIEKVVKATGEKSRSKAIDKALKEYLQRKAIDELRAMSGKIDIEDNWREQEDLEIEEQKKMQW